MIDIQFVEFNVCLFQNYWMIGKITITLLLFLLHTVCTLAQEPLLKHILVSDVGLGNNIGSANTSRNIAIDKDGTIYVAYTGSLGVRVAKSIDRGAAFLPSVQVDTGNYPPEIALGDDGIIYVAWMSGASIYLSRSLDNGVTFTDSNFVGLGTGFSPHMDVFEDNVYIVDQSGEYTYINNNKGVGSFNQNRMPKIDVYADVRVDKNGIVYVPSDDPTLYLSKSVNSGASFQEVNLSSVGQVFYSSYALSDSPSGTYIFVGGDGNVGYKIDATTGIGEQITLGPNNFSLEGRTLYADSFGALVDGYQEANGDLMINLSYDQGQTFSISIVVARGGSHNIDRNPLYDDINVVYEQDGNVYMNVYDGLLRGVKIDESIDSLSLCVNESFDLPYDLSGNFSPDSEFVAYLSDESGSFENKAFLGSIVSNSNGVIKCEIPNNLPNSEDYRIQIQSVANFIQSNIIGVNIGGEITATKPEDLFACSLNNSINEFDLTIQSDVIKNGKNTAIVSYFESQENAELNTGSIAKPTEYIISETSTIWARLETDKSSKCPDFDITSFEITIENVGVDDDNLSLSVCSETERAVYDLTIKESEISEDAEVIFTYYQSELDFNAGINISNPQTYEITDLMQEVLIFVEGKCSYLRTIELVTNIRASYNSNPNPLEICDSDNDGYEAFNLREIENDILSGLMPVENYEFRFYENFSEAELTSSNQIEEPENFTNTVKDIQIIYANVSQVGTNCLEVIPFEIAVKTSPVVAQKPVDMQSCNKGNDLAYFDLISQDDQIKNTQADTSVSYHTSESDAENNSNAIINSSEYESGNGIVWARLETSGDTSTFSCPAYDVVSFKLEVTEPSILEPSDIKLCSDTVEAIYDLTIRESEIFDEQNSTFSYYKSQEDYESSIEISDPKIYKSTSLNESIIIMVIDGNSCSKLTKLELHTTINATYNNFPSPLETCDNNNDGFEEFNLIEIESEILNGLSLENFEFTYYESILDAEKFNDNYIENPNTFINSDSNEQTLYVVVKQLDGDCYQLINFSIKINPTPQPNLKSTYSLCLDNDNKSINSLNTNLDNAPPIDTGLNSVDYEFRWFNGVDNSLENVIEEEIDSFYYPQTDGLYTVEILNRETGCTKIFNTEVIGSYPPISIEAEVVSLPFSKNNKISISVEGKGEYEYKIDDGEWQENNLFSRLSEGEHILYVRDFLNCDILFDLATIINYPKFFTPNGDGMNDLWKISDVGDPETVMVYIYDRYGKLVSQVVPNSNGWDGNFDGRPLPSNEYWFLLEYKQIGDTTLRKVKGHFSLIR